MNLRLDVAGLSGEWIGLNRDGVICEDLAGRVRFRKPGFQAENYIHHHAQDEAGRAIGLSAGRVVEITAPRGWAGLGEAVRMMRADAIIEPWRLALFEQCGELVVEAVALRESPDEIICACKGITRAEIGALVPSCPNRNAIAESCGASTICGSCGPMIDEIAGQGSMTAAELVEVQRLGDGIARFRFRYLPDVALCDSPGAYVLVQAVVEGRWLKRPYTITATEPDGSLEIIVKREASGVFSRWLHDHAGAEHPFRLSLPQSTRRTEAQNRVHFIAAGIGITPVFMELSPAGAEALSIHWSMRGGAGSRLAAAVRAATDNAGCALTIHDTATDGRVQDWASICPKGSAENVIVCGPPAFQQQVVAALTEAGWAPEEITLENFGTQRPTPAMLQHVDSFDYLQEPIVSDSFHLTPVGSVRDEAHAFLRQFYFEHGAPAAFDLRWSEVSAAIAESGTYVQTFEELAFGARLAWRNSARCIGRFFWKTLQIRDLRHLTSEDAIFSAIVSHLESATNGGDIQPIISVFAPSEPRIRILNPQLILYAGYRQKNGTVIGDPKNVELTEVAEGLGWKGKGGRFDVLPILIRIGENEPKLFELPDSAVLQVPLSHPREDDFSALGLQWFAVPAVSGMALDIGGIQYTAAPSNGFYMGTEIGSGNLAEPARYDEMQRVAYVMGIDTSSKNPLWRDQAMLDLNAAVLHSFQKAGVRILDHHTLSEYFMKFREAEAAAKRPSYGHWAWVMPPMGGNLSPIWRDNTLKKKILKPNYFYQPGPRTELLSAGCPVDHSAPAGGGCPMHKVA